MFKFTFFVGLFLLLSSTTYAASMPARIAPDEDPDKGPWHGFVINNPGRHPVLTQAYVLKYFTSEGQWDSLNIFTPKGATAAQKTTVFERNLKAAIFHWKMEMDWRGLELQEKYHVTFAKTIDLQFVIDRIKEMKEGHKKWSNPDKGRGIYEVQSSMVSDAGNLKYFDRLPYDENGLGEPMLMWFGEIAEMSLCCGNWTKDYTVSFTTPRYTQPEAIAQATQNLSTVPQYQQQIPFMQQQCPQYVQQQPCMCCPVYLNNLYGASFMPYCGPSYQTQSAGIFLGIYIALGMHYGYGDYQPYYGGGGNYYYTDNSVTNIFTDNSINDSFNTETTNYNGPRPIFAGIRPQIPDVTNGEGGGIIIGDTAIAQVPDVHNKIAGSESGLTQDHDQVKGSNEQIAKKDFSSPSATWAGGTDVAPAMNGNLSQLNSDLQIAMSNAANTATTAGNSTPTGTSSVPDKYEALNATWGGGTPTTTNAAAVQYSTDATVFNSNPVNTGTGTSAVNLGDKYEAFNATWGGGETGNGFSVNQSAAANQFAVTNSLGGFYSTPIATDVNQQQAFQNLSTTWGGGNAVFASNTGSFNPNAGTQFQGTGFSQTWNNANTFSTGVGTAGGAAWQNQNNYFASNNTIGFGNLGNNGFQNFNQTWSPNYQASQGVTYGGTATNNGYFNPQQYSQYNNYGNGGTLQTNTYSGGFGGYNPYLLSNNTTSGFTYNAPSKNMFTYTSGAGQTNNTTLSYNNALHFGGTKGSIFSGTTGGSGMGGTKFSTGKMNLRF